MKTEGRRQTANFEDRRQADIQVQTKLQAFMKQIAKNRPQQGMGDNMGYIAGPGYADMMRQRAQTRQTDRTSEALGLPISGFGKAIKADKQIAAKQKLAKRTRWGSEWKDTNPWPTPTLPKRSRNPFDL